MQNKLNNIQNYFRPSSTNPPQTYLPPLSIPQFVRQSRQIDPALIEDINNLVIPTKFSDFSESIIFDDQEQIDNKNDLLARKRRSSYNGEKEIISITLNFKGYQFS
jgi:hypothetical protein